MREGYIYNKTDAEVKSDVAKGLTVRKGVEVSSLLDSIIVREINFSGQPETVLASLKQDLMVLLGKMKIEEKK